MIFDYRALCASLRSSFSNESREWEPRRLLAESHALMPMQKC